MTPDARRRLLALSLSVVPLAGCGGGSETHPEADGGVTAVLTAGDHELRVDAAGLDVKLTRGGEVLLDLSADALQLGTVTKLDDGTNYDPTPLVIAQILNPPPADLRWLSPEKLAVSKQGKTSIDVALTYPEGKRATLHLEASAGDRFRATFTPDKDGAPVAYLRLRPRADAKEAFYGLGEHYDSVNQRGKVRPMQLEIDTSNESGYNEVHVPIPFVIGTRGWGLFVESPYPAVFSVATEHDDLVDAMFGTGLASTEGLTFHLFGAAHPLDVTKLYYDVTGYPRLPARWALGPWVWRDENKDQAQAAGDLETMRSLDLPATGYWVDTPYESAVGSFDWKPSQFPDPQALVDEAHDLGFRVALWHVPVMDEKADATQAYRDEATQKGYYPKVTGISLNPWGKLIDLTNPDAASWWQGLLHHYTDQGVEGFKLDYAEDVVPGLSPARNVWQFFDGSDERTMHARYQLFYHRTYQALLPASGGFLLGRHGTYGDQANMSVLWPGDLDSSFARWGDIVPNDSGQGTYTAVGGLPATLIAGLTLGPSGFPFFGADTGGYLHAPPDKELFTRWFEQTALSTVMQMGNHASTVAWEPDPATGFDDEMLGWYRTYTRLHLRLFPYEWTYAQRLQKDGRPIQRALGLAYPELGQHPDDEYLFGDDLLVAPVVDRGAVTRSVIFPNGNWIDWWTGEVVAGGGMVTVDAPLDTLPLYVREGAIVPMLRPTIQAMAPVKDPTKVDSYATSPGLLWARVAPGAASSFTVFDGAVLSQERTATGLTLGSKDGSEFSLGVVFEVVAVGAKPKSVTDGAAPLEDRGTAAALDAATSGWAYLPDAGGTLLVKVPGGAHSVEVQP